MSRKDRLGTLSKNLKNEDSSVTFSSLINVQMFPVRESVLFSYNDLFTNKKALIHFYKYYYNYHQPKND